MTNLFAVVLAAGKGTRMKSSLYKVLHPVCGKPMVDHVVGNMEKLGASEIVSVVGHGAEMVKETLGDRSTYVVQEEQLGTAHAVQQAEQVLDGREGTTIVICGDTPLITPETIQQLMETHKEAGAKATILTAIVEDPTGYGRILRGQDDLVTGIVEQKDATPDQQKVQEINSGTYCFDNQALFEALKKVDNNNSQGEYYLTDVISILKEQGEAIAAFAAADAEELLGVNDRVALSQAESYMRNRLALHHMREGVTIIDPASTYIGADVVIGSDTVLLPGTMLEGNTVIGEKSTIGPNTHLKNAHIGNETTVHSSVVMDSKIADHVAVGPFAHIRPGSDLGDHVKIGNFVEVKKSTIQEGSKLSHLTYMGDAEIGKNVNIGCGTISVNYDGKNKFTTTIEDNAFIGCNSNLVAPVTVGKGAYVAAGTTVTKNVTEDSLAIGRVKQENKEGYAKRIK
ncbi:bifunctional UDP-N-acetylglucosamine pyrophosphorylase/glucosamine-1-phosphate N-acetyltransferase [Chryseomicrobium aureum]|uniref:bifunctional UDP-N-acetylglucosamine diphosphorylase/glucosamine-1-phosphate N-acetyltransferase GlmU n=1 Tax=Chryseomicrobium aureum TaxID=1441723 RepID=UPI00195DACE3|nr:bifunctional UDP-N-acetylglucosamine diphosphorylase/glucosamine-1-phosphate N-acetyltransferase GlmU [Chryseomicrobium aureum]MBM7707283.1 bifunctional UDP-N-acetylglucosamine pyrophosphorylase/glucosamine-1-phosphate N-acetyltransferase [Chryseomicrobium aureum]